MFSHHHRGLGEQLRPQIYPSTSSLDAGTAAANQGSLHSRETNRTLAQCRAKSPAIRSREVPRPAPRAPRDHVFVRLPHLRMLQLLLNTNGCPEIAGSGRSAHSGSSIHCGKTNAATSATISRPPYLVNVEVPPPLVLGYELVMPIVQECAHHLDLGQIRCAATFTRVGPVAVFPDVVRDLGLSRPALHSPLNSSQNGPARSAELRRE